MQILTIPFQRYLLKPIFLKFYKMIPLLGVQAYVTQSNLLFAYAYKMLPQE